MMAVFLLIASGFTIAPPIPVEPSPASDARPGLLVVPQYAAPSPSTPPRPMHLWLPESLRDLAGPPARIRVIQDPNWLRSFLEARAVGKLRTAVTLRSTAPDGSAAEVLEVGLPLEDHVHYQKLHDGLIRFVPGPLDSVKRVHHGVTVHVLPEAVFTGSIEDLRAETRRRLDDVP